MNKMLVAIQTNPTEGTNNLAMKARGSNAVTDVPFQQFLSKEMGNRASERAIERAPEQVKPGVETKDTPSQTAPTQGGGPVAKPGESQASKEDGVDSEGTSVAGNEEETDKTQVVVGNAAVIEHMLAIAGKIAPTEKSEATELVDAESEAKLDVMALTADQSGEESESNLAALMARQDASGKELGDDAGQKETEMPVTMKETNTKDSKAEVKVQDETADKVSFSDALNKAGNVVVPKAPPVETQVNQVVQAQQAVSQVQNVAPELAKAQIDPASNRIMQQVGTEAWNQAIGQKAIWMVGKEQHSASLTLNPPDLGPLQVVLKVSNNHATASFMSAHSDVRAALEDSMPRLRAMMEQAGIQLGQTHVGADTPNNQYGSQSDQKAASRVGGGANEIDGMPDMQTQTVRQTVRQGLVDTFA